MTDVGVSFAGVQLTQAAYKAVEDAYAASAIRFLRDALVETLTVCGLENARKFSPAPAEGDTLQHGELAGAIRQVLREDFWCRFQAANAFVHVGWDFYMYIGVPEPCTGAREAAQQLGLFVEPFASPYGF